MPEEVELTTVVYNVGLHCEGCAQKVWKQLRKMPGIDDLKVERKTQQVTVKGKSLDPNKVLKKLQDMGKDAQIVKITKEKEKAKEPPPPPPPPPPIHTTVLKMALHCKGCAQKVQQKLYRAPGVHEVKVELDRKKVTVKGTAEPGKVLQAAQKTGKAVELWPAPAAPAAPAAPPAAAAAAAAAPPAAAAAAAAPPKEPVKESKETPKVNEKEAEMKMPEMTYRIEAPQYITSENPNTCAFM